MYRVESLCLARRLQCLFQNTGGNGWGHYSFGVHLTSLLDYPGTKVESVGLARGRQHHSCVCVCRPLETGKGTGDNAPPPPCTIQHRHADTWWPDVQNMAMLQP